MLRSGEKAERLYFHPYKPVPWLLTHQGILLYMYEINSSTEERTPEETNDETKSIWRSEGYGTPHPQSLATFEIWISFASRDL